MRKPGAGNDFQARDTWTNVTPVFSVLSRWTPPGHLCLTSMASRAILELRPETLLLHCRRSNLPGPGWHGRPGVRSHGKGAHLQQQSSLQHGGPRTGTTVFGCRDTGCWLPRALLDSLEEALHAKVADAETQDRKLVQL